MSDPGVLWLVGTPIGNLGDVSPVAAACLAAVDVVAAEDTRRTRTLLSAIGVSPRRLVSIRAETELAAVEGVLRWLAEGRDVALVTDAGMPGLSDPGGRLVRGVLDGGGAVRVAPGPDAASTAVVATGFGGARWCFDGFVPRRPGRRREWVAGLADQRRVVVAFEAPHRLLATLAELADALPEHREVALANDLTKRFERVERGSARTIRDAWAGGTPRGEFVVVIAPAGRGPGPDGPG